MDLNNAARSLRDRWWIVLGLLALTLVATFFHLDRAERRYTATASIAVLPGADARAQDSFPGLIGRLLPTMAERIESNDVLEDVITAVPGAPRISELRGMVTGVAVKDTLELRVVVEDTDPERAATLANNIARLLPVNDISGGLVSYSALDLARVPTTPTSPRPRLVVALGLLVGLALSGGTALLLGPRSGQPRPPKVERRPKVDSRPVRGAKSR